MHPVLSDRTRLGVYLLAWTPGIALLAAQFIATGWTVRSAFLLAVPACLLAAAGFLSSYYLCRALPLKETRPAVLLGTWATDALLMGLFWAAGVRFVSKLIQERSFPPALFVGLAGTGAIFYIVTVTYHYLLISAERAREAETLEQELRALAREAELKALRAQLNPHFLFNSLNSISALTTRDPLGARAMCVLLSDFLRKSLKLGERPMVTLAEELDLVKAYLAIEQIRFGARLQVVWAVAAEVEPVRIPTLLLQPLVENAIKHGLANLLEGGLLRIAAHQQGALLVVEMENTRDPEEVAPKGLGLGLTQVRQRLKGRYGSQAWLEAQVLENAFRIRLAFPIETNEESHD